jgi:hypothetical protein
MVPGLLLLAGCATGPDRLAREDRWQEVLAQDVPPGTSRDAATEVLMARGMVVRYRPYAELGERPDECPASRLYAQHYGELNGLAPRFDVRLILCLDNEGRVFRSVVDRYNSVI